MLACPAVVGAHFQVDDIFCGSQKRRVAHEIAAWGAISVSVLVCSLQAVQGELHLNPGVCAGVQARRIAAECDLLRHQLDALRQQSAQGQAAAGPSGDVAVLKLQQQLQDSEARRQVAESRTAELEGQVEAMVEQLGSSADQSVVALEKEVGLAV